MHSTQSQMNCAIGNSQAEDRTFKQAEELGLEVVEKQMAT